LKMKEINCHFLSFKPKRRVKIKIALQAENKALKMTCIDSRD